MEISAKSLEQLWKKRSWKLAKLLAAVTINTCGTSRAKDKIQVQGFLRCGGRWKNRSWSRSGSYTQRLIMRKLVREIKGVKVSVRNASRENSLQLLRRPGSFAPGPRDG
jgi:hypothetical protein